jgi:Domain of Unknown Function (DUF1259)
MSVFAHRAAAFISCLLLAGPALAEDARPSWDAVDKILGQIGKNLPGDVHRYSWPRRDLHVTVGGTPVAPALALGSWTGFTAGEHSMAMGDLVLLSSEVNPVIRALQAGGLEVLAIHNHLLGETPQVLYVHFAGHGAPEGIAKTLKTALAATGTPTSAPAAAAVEPSAAEKAAFDEVQASLGRKGSPAGHVLQVGVPRASKIEEDGAEVPPTLGMAISMNFEVAGSKVVATGDFVLVAEEVNPVIRELEGHGIQVTALHSHMLRESPRLFFMHFWAVDQPAKVGEGLKAALSKVAVQEPK